MMKADYRLTQALADADQMLDRGWWVTIRVDQGISLTHGAMLSNGEREQAITTIIYEKDGAKTRYVHP